MKGAAALSESQQDPTSSSTSKVQGNRKLSSQAWRKSLG